MSGSIVDSFSSIEVQQHSTMQMQAINVHLLEASETLCWVTPQESHDNISGHVIYIWRERNLCSIADSHTRTQ